MGPHLTREAQRLGWKVTHFNRGKKSVEGLEGVETLIGDRKGKLDALRNRRWDAMVDDTGYIPKYCHMSAQLLGPEVRYALFISSISVYDSFAHPNDEHSPLGKLTDPEAEEVTDTTYGPMKVLCEHYNAQAFAKRLSIVRPGYIVGPLDPTDRFTYWPVRYARGGEMLVPGTPDDPIQIIDVRDLTGWMMQLVNARTQGTFNAVSAPHQFTMGQLLQACRDAAPDAKTQVTWVPEAFLARQWKPEELDLPPWAPLSGDSAGASLTSSTLATRAGLRCRPLEETVRDTLQWFRTLPSERQAKLHAGLDAQREDETLRAWHKSEKAG
ncbi:MAG: epimerase [Gammaproteobacteria bacterium]|nr:epimerase [Gammaproteobacteria bacterium]